MNYEVKPHSFFSVLFQLTSVKYRLRQKL